MTKGDEAWGGPWERKGKEFMCVRARCGLSLPLLEQLALGLEESMSHFSLLSDSHSLELFIRRPNESSSVLHTPPAQGFVLQIAAGAKGKFTFGMGKNCRARTVSLEFQG